MKFFDHLFKLLKQMALLGLEIDYWKVKHALNAEQCAQYLYVLFALFVPLLLDVLLIQKQYRGGEGNRFLKHM